MKLPLLKTEAHLLEAISLLGEVRRDLSITKAELDDKIARLQRFYAPTIEEIQKNEQELVNQITTYCNNHFETLFKGNLKTAKLITGEISRRVKPTSIVVNDLDAALAKLKELGLREFIRVKEEINKNALLDSPEIIDEIEGLELQKGLENLIIKPYST